VELSMRRVLPVGRPLLRTYLFYLYPFTILAQSDDHLAWLFGRCIQLLYYPGECLKMLVEPGSVSSQLGHAYRLSCPLLDIQTLALETLASLEPDPVRACVRLIEGGTYVQLDVDYFHLRHTPDHGRRHFLHELLLYGVDTGRDSFTAAAYGPRGDPVAVEVPFAELARAAAGTPAPERGASPPDESLWGRPRAILYRYHPERRCALDLVSVGEQIADYLHGADSSGRYRLQGLARPGGVWGTAVYGWLHDQLEEACRAPAAICPLTWRVLYEHKVCMERRLGYLAATAVPAAGELADQYRAVIRCARALQVLLLRWSAAPAGTPAAARVAHAHLGQMAAVEARVLGRVLDAI